MELDGEIRNESIYELSVVISFVHKILCIWLLRTLFLITIYISCDAAESVLSSYIVIIKKKDQILMV